MKNLLVIAICIALTGCTGNRKLTTIRFDLEAHKQELEKMLRSLEALDEKRAAKWEKGELDEKTDSIMRNYAAQLKDSIAVRLQRFDALSDNKALRKNKKAAIAYLNKVKESYKKELDNIIFFDDLFDASTFNRLNTAAFFSSGQYALSDTTFNKASAIMRQIVTDALHFSARYPSRKLKALFIVTGYADEEAIAPGSKLHQSLAASVSSSDAIARKQLNKELSLRRATFIKDILSGEYFSAVEKNSAANLSASFLAMGKGEELPRGQITDYRPIDERRRVVLLYWSILPEL